MELFKISLEESKKVFSTSDKLDILLASRGSLEIEIYKPEKVDHQKPHKKDEIYIIINGEGNYICGERKTKFKAHDVLFAAAGEAHRFEDFTSDFLTWVIFYGPEGGEV